MKKGKTEGGTGCGRKMSWGGDVLSLKLLEPAQDM